MVTTFRIDPDLLEILDKYAVKDKLNHGDTIRKAIIHMIENGGAGVTR